eukprot:9269512-Pyramimonas_sp.AAC.1
MGRDFRGPRIEKITTANHEKITTRGFRYSRPRGASPGPETVKKRLRMRNRSQGVGRNPWGSTS